MEIREKLARMFNMKADEIDYEIDENEDEDEVFVFVFGTTDDSRFDTVAVNMENLA